MASTQVDEYVTWEPEVEEEEEHVVDSPTARPISEVDTIRITRKAVLADLVKSLGGKAPTYGFRRTGAGFDGHVRAKVPETRGSTSLLEMYGSSNAACSTKDGAEEQAAEGLIRCLKRNFKVEVDEINWREKNQYDNDEADARDEIEKLEREIGDLKVTVDSLKHGWSTTLSLLESVHGMARATRPPAGLYPLNSFYVLDPGRYALDPGHVMQDVSRLEEYILRTLTEGSKKFNHVARMEKRMEEQRAVLYGADQNDNELANIMYQP